MKKIFFLFLGANACFYLGYALRAQRDEEGQRLQLRLKTAFKNTSPAQTSRRSAVGKKIEEADITRAGQANAGPGPDDMKVANSIERNPQLSSRVKPLLPARTNLTDAAAGFRNQGQFIAALHASKNLNIPFNEIKTRMTGEDGISLTAALRELRPGMTRGAAKAEVRKAEEQARADEKQAYVEANEATAEARETENGKT